MISGIVGQLLNIRFAAMAGKQQVLCPVKIKCVRQIRSGSGDSALAINPDGARQLIGGEKIMQSGQAAGVKNSWLGRRRREFRYDSCCVVLLAVLSTQVIFI